MCVRIEKEFNFPRVTFQANYGAGFGPAQSLKRWHDFDEGSLTRFREFDERPCFSLI
jgi:hypothetical protein